MQKSKRVLVATLFNLAFEYSLRGLVSIRFMPLLPFILFVSYFTLFTLVEDLIARFKLKDYQLMILAFFYGTIYDSWISGVNFLPPLFLGVNWVNFFVVNFFWWGLLQAILTFYLAGRIAPRNWQEPLLTKRSWVICLVIQFLIIGLFQKSGVIVYGSSFGKLMMLIVLLVIFFIFKKQIRKNELVVGEFLPSRFLDFLAIATFFFFLFCALSAKNLQQIGTSIISPVNYKLVSRWTFILGLLLLFYRLKTKKEISI